uniref:DUF6567 family protein n=1 Tax=Alistipes sp. TaxID=1872444 RepID=UPI004057384F
MKKFNFFLAMCLLLLCGGCAGVLYPLTDRDLLPEQITLTHGSYRVVREVSGRTHALYILGIGGMKAKPRDSFDRMISNARLAPNQTIINVKTEHKVRGWLGYGRYSIVAQHDIVTYGTVIEFVDTPQLQAPASAQLPEESRAEAGEEPQDEITLYLRSEVAGGHKVGETFLIQGEEYIILAIQPGIGYLITTALASDVQLGWLGANTYCVKMGNEWRLPLADECVMIYENRRELRTLNYRLPAILS